MTNKTRIILILYVLMLCVLGSLGFARFSFGAILPFMKEGLSFDYSETGIVASFIFFGYLLSSFLSGHFIVKFSSKIVIISALILAVIGMILIGISNSIWLASLGSIFMGLGSGGANVPALGVVARWFAPKKRGLAMGIVNSGAGFGMVLSGVLVPFIIKYNPIAGWRISWYILAALTIIIVLICLFFLKNDPAEVSMKPVGANDSDEKTKNMNEDKTIIRASSVYQDSRVWFLGTTYLLWGFSYLVFSTFLVDYLMIDVHFEKVKAGQFFAAAGLISVFSGFLWGGISDRIGRVLTLATVYVYQGILLILMVLTHSSVLLFILVAGYGLSLWAVPTVTNATVSEWIRKELVPIAMGFLTLFFGIGQFISPMINGLILDYTKAYSFTFYLSAAVVISAGICAFTMHMKMKRE